MTPAIDAELRKVRVVLEWRFTRSWPATVAYWLAERLAGAVQAAERGRCSVAVVRARAADFVDHVRGTGQPRARAIGRRLYPGKK